VPVQIIENWTSIHGAVTRCTASSDLKGFCRVEVAVDQAEAVTGYPNLLEQARDTLLVIHIPEELVMKYEIIPESEIQCRVRLAGLGRVFVHHEHIMVESPPEVPD